MILRTIVCFCIILSICVSCAKQSSPTGGPKDTIPPILVRSFPFNKQLNVTSKKVDLEFDEMVILNNPKEQIIITPVIGKDYEVTAKKKTVIIEFEKGFSDSTTYTINFRDAVQDITEKNPARNLQLAFSTGTYIDSISIDGRVYNILNDKESKTATVALYQNADTFNILKHKPAYFTKTNDKGYFKMENLKIGKYFIYAFEDQNRNIMVDSKSESYGFKIGAIDLSTNVENVLIPIQRLDSRELKLNSARPYENYFNIKTSKNLTTYTIIADSNKLVSSFGSDHANIKVYNTLNITDSLKCNLSLYDSVNNKLDTTIYIKFSDRKIEPEKFSFSIEENKVLAGTGLLQLKIKFNKPITKINFDSLYFQADSINTIYFSTDELNWDYPNNKLIISKTVDKKFFLKETKKQFSPPQKTTKTKKHAAKNELIIGKGAFISVDNDSTKAINQKPKILQEEEAGTLLIDIKTLEKNFILELIDNNYKTVLSVKNKASLKFENLFPANYLIKLIIDQNNNGKWDPGNYLRKEEPEPIIFYKNEKEIQTVNLKANWELGPLLITY